MGQKMKTVMRLKRFVYEYTKNTPLFDDLSLRVIAPNILCTVIGQLREAIDSIYPFPLLDKYISETA